MTKKITAVVLAFLVVVVVSGACSRAEGSVLVPRPRLKLATTTSLYDTGLWSYLEPMFEKKHAVELDVLYAGSGIALEYGRRGDVDVVTIHDKPSEEKFVADGFGLRRVPFAYNHFIIVGPKDDPAGIKALSPEDAFKRLFEAGSASFVSRGDDSGTHAKEKAIWKKAGRDYEAVRRSGAWYIDAGRGMGPTLLMASEKRGYTLSDIGTFLSYKGKLDLVPLVDRGGSLLNVYSAIAVNPAKKPGVNADMASRLVDFLTSPEVQKLIRGYGARDYGTSLFTPCAGNEPME